MGSRVDEWATDPYVTHLARWLDLTRELTWGEWLEIAVFGVMVAICVAGAAVWLLDL